MMCRKGLHDLATDGRTRSDGTRVCVPCKRAYDKANKPRKIRENFCRKNLHDLTVHGYIDPSTGVRRCSLCQKDNYARRNQTEKHRAGVRANRALRAGAVSEPYTMQDIVDRDRTDCSFCGKTVDLLETDRRTRPSVDHTIPLARGGTDTLDNVTLMHLSCNQQKGIKIMESAA